MNASAFRDVLSTTGHFKVLKISNLNVITRDHNSESDAQAVQISFTAATLSRYEAKTQMSVHPNEMAKPRE